MHIRRAANGGHESEIHGILICKYKEDISGKMSVQVEKLEKNMVKLTIEVSAEEVEKAIQNVYLRSKRGISIPGFRKGKAPRALIEKMYGKEVFYSDAVEALLPSAYSKAADECGEELVSRPAVDVVQMESGKPFIFTAVVALKPEVKLGKYKGVEVEAVSAEVSEEEVNEKLTGKVITVREWWL